MEFQEESQQQTYHDFRDEDISKYDIVYSDDEDDYGISEDSNELPDLYKYLDALTSSETDLDGPDQPPSLFNRPEHKHNYNNISLLKYEVDEESVHQYLQDFETGIKDEVLHVGKITLEEIQEEEKRLRDEHIAFQQQELQDEKLRYEEALKLEDFTKRNVAKNLKEQRRLLARKVEIAKQKERLQLDSLHKAFKRYESRLTTNLIRKGAVIQTMYGDLSLADGEYGGAKGRRWKLDWTRTPQPIQIKLKSIRGVKDKLPGGRYVLLTSLYNRLGGSIVKWSNLKGQQWGAATLPIIHNGNFFNIEMPINQSVFTVLPPHNETKPSMMLVFELFLLRGSVVQTDRVVSWGCFPVCDNNMDIIEGKYKAPFLRGEVDSNIDKSITIEELISSDLDHWMCNLYFEVIKLPRYMAGQKEFEVELQYSTDLLTAPEKIDEIFNGNTLTPKQYLNFSDMDLQQKHSSVKGVDKPEVISPGVLARKNLASSESFTSNTPIGHQNPAEGNNSTDGQSLHGSVKNFQRPMTTYGSRFAKKDSKKIHLDDSSDDDESSILQLFPVQNSVSEKPVKGVPELSYQRCLNPISDVDAKKVYTMLPQTAILKKKTAKFAQTYQEKLKLHRVSVKKDYRRKKGESYYQAEHVRRQLMSELGLTDPSKREFWTMVMIFIITFFIRIYIHYLGQWLFLTAAGIPISNFQFLPYIVRVTYHNTLLHIAEEIAVVAAGPLLVFLIFVLAIVFCAITQKALKTFPETGHKVLLCFGLHAFLDPIFIMIIDAGIKSWDYVNLSKTDAIADFAKLYWHFLRTDGTGLGGIFVTFFIYAFTMFLSGSVIYMFFLRLYNNGRLLDNYWRLHSLEEEMFVPYDLEMSSQELDLICKKAEQYRGEEGERRKISVYDYEWIEELIGENGKVTTNKEKTSHLSIHTVHLDGLRELYRHFLITPEGAILEVFQESTKASVLETVKASSDGHAHVPSYKVKGRQTVLTTAGFHHDDDANYSRSSASMSSDDESKKEV